MGFLHIFNIALQEFCRYNEEVENAADLFKSQVSHYFAYAFALLPDELQAQQLVIDSTQAVFLENHWEMPGTPEELKKLIYLKIFQIGQIRSQQLSTSLIGGISPEQKIFYELSLLERSALFLFFIQKCDRPWMAFIMGQTTAEILSLINRGREKLFKLSGEKFPWPTQPNQGISFEDSANAFNH